MDKIRVGVVGLKHGMAGVKEVIENEDYELVALCSLSRETYDYLCGGEITAQLDSVTFTDPRELLIRQCRAKKDFREVDFYTDYDRFLDHGDLQAVIIAVPIPLNAELPIRALRKNKHVFVSKPFALTLKEGLELKKVVEEAGSKFMVNYEFRHSPVMQNIRRLRITWWNMFRMPFRPAYATWATSGGAFVAEVCHWFDLFHLFNSESEFKRICAFGGLDVLGDRGKIIADTDEAKRGFESLLISIAAQKSSDQGRIVSREDALTEVG